MTKKRDIKADANADTNAIQESALEKLRRLQAELPDTKDRKGYRFI